MAKLDKVDIKVEDLISEDINIDEISEEEKAKLNYETALRYVGIAEHMKQFEDQDKYFLRAQKYLKAAEPIIRDKELKRSVIIRKFKARSEGKIALYKEACSIRDKAKTPSDFRSAQNLFERINKYEEKHPLKEKWIDPEVYKEALNCSDSKEQAQYCASMAEKKEKQNQRKSMFASFVFLACIGGILYFARTLSFYRFLAAVNVATGDYNTGWHYYLRINLSEKASEAEKEEALNQYHKYRYMDAEKALEKGDEKLAYKNFKILAKHEYKDAQKRFVAMEKERLKKVKVGEIIGFGNMDWIVLKKNKKKQRILLYKKTAKGHVPFNKTGEGTVTWETSTVRTWLNNDFINEYLYEEEAAMLIPVKVKNTPNMIYGTDSGRDTIDKVFLMSYDEFLLYQYKLNKKTASSWWLRTSGKTKNTMAFVYNDRSVMAEGFDVTTDKITLKPMMWVNLK